MYRWPVWICWSVITGIISVLQEATADTCNDQREVSVSVNELHLTLWPKEVQSLPEGFKLIWWTFFFFFFFFHFLSKGCKCSQPSMIEASASVWSNITVKVWSLAHVKESYPFVLLDAAVFLMLWHLHEKVEWVPWKKQPKQPYALFFLDSLLHTLLCMWHHYYIALKLCCRSLTHQCPRVQWNWKLISSKNPIHHRLIHNLPSTGAHLKCNHSLCVSLFSVTAVCLECETPGISTDPTL